MPEQPTIVVFCGSTRFGKEFREHEWLATLAGKIVLTVGAVGDAVHELKHAPPDHLAEWYGADMPERLDELHKRKIDLADEVFVLNVGGYIGDSTRSEIEYAQGLGKPISYLEPRDG